MTEDARRRSDAVEDDTALRPLADAYVRHRRLLFAVAVGFLLLSFNGQWIVERDTSLYRGLGHTLASGQGYTFGEFGASVVYPGLPLILAGLELTFGETALPAILLMNAMALATLAVTYRLMRLRFAKWVAVAITVGVGLNARFVQAAQEIMTDVPFLLGIVLFLYGWERLTVRMRDEGRRAKEAEGGGASSVAGRPSSLFADLAYLVPGLVLALSMRPTFWILAVAWGLVCVWGLIRGPRKLYVTCLLLVVGIVAAWFVLDPRVRGFNPLGGGYEQQFLDRLGRVGVTMRRNVPDFLTRQFSEGFFNGRFGKALTPAVALALIGTTWFLFRRGLVLWGLLILCTIGVTLLIEVVPRYYLMILPVLMASYVLAFRALANRTGPRWGPLVFTAGVALLVIPNVVRGSKFIYEQHWKDPGRRIEWQRSIVAAEMIRDHVPEGAAALAPGAPIVSYLSGRDVYMAREIFPEHADPIEYPQLLKDKGIEYAIWPPNKIRDQEGLIAQLMDHGVIVPTGVVTRDLRMSLVTIDVVVPPEGVDWRTNPAVEHEWVTTTRRGPTSDQIRRQQRLQREAYEARLRRERNEMKARVEARLAREAKAAREARERREMKERMEMRKRREARDRQAANARRLQRLREQAATQSTTQPATAPSTGPTTQPTSIRSGARDDPGDPPPAAAAEAASLAASRFIEQTTTAQGRSPQLCAGLGPPPVARVARGGVRCVGSGAAVAWRGLS